MRNPGLDILKSDSVKSRLGFNMQGAAIRVTSTSLDVEILKHLSCHDYTLHSSNRNGRLCIYSYEKKEAMGRESDKGEG